MLELFPEGFVEQQAGEAVELVAFTDEAGADRLQESVGAVVRSPVAPGWEDEWKRFHKPVTIGSVWIGPPWSHPEPELLRVWIDPGQAFGTGAHPTTQLCLKILQGLEPASLLDVGCGSGVLAIAALRLGFGPVVAIDSDVAAVEATTRNASANMLELDIRHVDALTESLPGATIVLANLDLPTLEALAPPLGCRMLVTSGYSENDQPAFAGFGHAARQALANWAADLFMRG